MKKYGFLLLILVIMAGCVSQKRIVLIQSPKKQASYDYPAGKRREVKIEPMDELYINVNSIDQSGYNFFKPDMGATMSITEASIAVLSYTVNDSGFILLPFLGKLKVSGLTTEEAAIKIQEEAKSRLNSPMVSVRFVNSYVTVLGEVQKPGTYSYLKQQMTIFKAIGLASDLTEYGNRRKVALLREDKNGVHKYYLDLTKDDIINSEFYYLRPNDVIYIEPLKVRWWGMKEFPFMLLMAALTNYLLIWNYSKKG